MTTASNIAELGTPTLAPPAAAAAAPTRRLLDYYELTKPRMNFLVVVTTAVGYYMAARGFADWGRFVHALVGTALTAASASIFNQFVERDYDALMDRTADRPLPAGRVAPGEAMALGLIAGIVGLGELLLFVNPLTAALAALTLGSYVLLYTPLKRRTTLCTIVGAVPGAIPAAMGWTAATGHIAAPAIALFGILFVWQMPHFLAIATLYRDDYARGGFKMLPVVDRDLLSTGFQIVIWSLALIPVTLMPYAFGMAGRVYFISAVLMGVIFTGFGILCAMKRGRAEARQLFLVSIIYLPFLLGSMMIDRV
jgi:protoheme IX farnesyltransferase